MVVVGVVVDVGLEIVDYYFGFGSVFGDELDVFVVEIFVDVGGLIVDFVDGVFGFVFIVDSLFVIC